jgi:hypothetical protein
MYIYQSIIEWTGISGKPINSTQLEEIIKKYESFVYIGHGAGEKYISVKEIQNFKEIKASILLFGCQSGK